MVQPFLGDADEMALVYLDGEYSHASGAGVPLPAAGGPGGPLPRRGARPGRGDRGGGHIAEAALACAPASLLYGRVDLMGGRVLELEIAEPSLYSGSADGAAETRFAAAISAGTLQRRPAAAPAARRLQWGRRVSARRHDIASGGPARRDLRVDLGHRPLQLPLRLLHAEGGLRPRLPLPDRERAAHASRRSRGWRARSSRIGVEKIRLTGGEPLLRRDLERLIEHAGRDRRPRPDADDERLAAAAEGAGARATPACGASRSASTRSTTRSSGR